MLLNYLRALLARFYSKNESGAITSLRNIDDSKKIIVYNGSLNGEKTTEYTAPTNGKLISYINGNTRINGIVLQNGYFISLINFGSLSNAANSSVSADLRKGERVNIHSFTNANEVRNIVFFPFVGEG